MSKKVYFIDLECLCEEKSIDRNSIIAISIVSLDDTVERTQLLKPWKNFKVSKFCTELTGITQEQLENSPLLEEVYSELFSGIDGEEHTIYAWGKDEKTLANVTFMKKTSTKLNVVDFQKIVQDYCDLAQRPGLDMTMTMLKGKHGFINHSVLDDTLMLREVYKAFKTDTEGFKQGVRLAEFNKRVQDLYKEYKDVIK